MRSYTLGTETYEFRGYGLGEEAVFPPSSGVAAESHSEEVEELFGPTINVFMQKVGTEFSRVPYCFAYQGIERIFGDFVVNPDEFHDIAALHTPEEFNPCGWARDIWNFSRLKQNQRFHRSDIGAFARGLTVENGRLVLSIGSGSYQQAAYGMNSDGLVLSLTPKERKRLQEELDSEDFSELKRLAAVLGKKYGAHSTIRRAIYAECKAMPPVGERVYSHLLGCASLIMTEDEEFVFGRRVPKTTAVNHGISAPISGGLDFDERSIRELGFPLYAISEILREAREEIGILGNRCRVVPLAFTREGPRGWCPDILALTLFFGSTEELIEHARRNPNPHKAENLELLALPRAAATSLVRNKEARTVLQHKGLVSLIMAIRYLESR